MSNSIPPEDMGRLFAELKEIKDGTERLEARVEQGFAEQGLRIESAAKSAQKAYDQSTSALKLASDTQVKYTETERAMMSYAQASTAAAETIVEANAAQTPLIERTADLMEQLKKQAPRILGGVMVLGMIARALLDPILSLWHH